MRDAKSEKTGEADRKELAYLEESFIIFAGRDYGQFNDSTILGRLRSYPDDVSFENVEAIDFNRGNSRLLVFFHESRVKAIRKMLDENKNVYCRFIKYDNDKQNVTFEYSRVP